MAGGLFTKYFFDMARFLTVYSNSPCKEPSTLSPRTTVLNANAKLIQKLQSSLETSEEHILELEKEIKQKDEKLRLKDELIIKHKKEIDKLLIITHDIEELKKYEQLSIEQDQEIKRLKDKVNEKNELMNSLKCIENENSGLRDELSKLQNTVSIKNEEIKILQEISVNFDIQLKERDHQIESLSTQCIGLSQENEELIQNLKFALQNVAELNASLKEQSNTNNIEYRKVWSTEFHELQLQEDIMNLNNLKDQLEKEKEQLAYKLNSSQDECKNLMNSLMVAKKDLENAIETNNVMKLKLEEFLVSCVQTRNDISYIIKTMAETLKSLEHRIDVLAENMEMNENKEEIEQFQYHEIDANKTLNKKLITKNVLESENERIKVELKTLTEKNLQAETEIKKLNQIIFQKDLEIKSWKDLKALYTSNIALTDVFVQKLVSLQKTDDLGILLKSKRMLSVMDNAMCSVNEKILSLNDELKAETADLNWLHSHYRFLTVMRSALFDLTSECSNLEEEMKLKEMEYRKIALSMKNAAKRELEKLKESIVQLNEQNKMLMKENLEIMEDKSKLHQQLNGKIEMIIQQSIKIKLLESQKNEALRVMNNTQAENKELLDHIWHLQTLLQKKNKYSKQAKQKLEERVSNSSANVVHEMFMPQHHSSFLSAIGDDLVQNSCTIDKRQMERRETIATICPNLSDDDRYASRFSEMQRRNSLCLPHLKTCYPVETQQYKDPLFAEQLIKEETVTESRLSSSFMKDF